MSVSNQKLELSCASPLLGIFPVQNIQDVFSVLRPRLPMSANTYNMAIMHSSYVNQVSFYILSEGNTCTENSWVIAVYKRDVGCGMEIIISTPSQVLLNNDTKQVFFNWSVLNWDQSYCFAVADQSLATLIFETSKMKNSSTTATGMTSCNFYTFPPDQVINIPKVAEIELKPMDPIVGGEFFYRTWKYAKYSSLIYLRRVLERSPSSGVYVNGESCPVSGMAVNGYGVMSMLFTEPEYRNKGYGKIVMQHLIKEVLGHKMIPCSYVEDYNSISQEFHSSIGMKVVGRMHFIYNDM